MDEYYDYLRNQFVGGGFTGVPFNPQRPGLPPGVRLPQPVRFIAPAQPAFAAPPPQPFPTFGYPPPGYPPPGYPPPGFPPPFPPPGPPPCPTGLLGALGGIGGRRLLPILVDNVLKGWAAFSGTPPLPTGSQLEDTSNLFKYLDTFAQYVKSDEQKRFFGGLARDIL